MSKGSPAILATTLTTLTPRSCNELPSGLGDRTMATNRPGASSSSILNWIPRRIGSEGQREWHWQTWLSYSQSITLEQNFKTFGARSWTGVGCCAVDIVLFYCWILVSNVAVLVHYFHDWIIKCIGTRYLIRLFLFGVDSRQVCFITVKQWRMRSTN